MAFQCSSAAQTQDEIRSGRTCKVNYAEASPDDDIDDADADRLVYNAQQSEATRLPDDIFKSLPSDDRRQWIGFSDEAKKSIIASLGTKPAPSAGSRRRRRINKAEALPDDEASIHSDQSEVSEDHNPSINVNQAETSPPATTASSTDATKNAHPADVRRMLSKQSKSKITAKNVNWSLAERPLDDSSADASYTSDHGYDLNGGYQSDHESASDHEPSDLQRMLTVMATAVDDYADSSSSDDEDFW